MEKLVESFNITSYKSVCVYGNVFHIFVFLGMKLIGNEANM